MHNKVRSPLPLLVKLCSDKAAFEVRPVSKLPLNIDEIKRVLEESLEHEILVHTSHMVILRSGRAETTLSRDGRMLIKRVSNEAEATQVAHQIFQKIFKEALKR